MSRLRPISAAQRQRNKEWRHVKRERAESVEYRCEAHIEGVCDGYGVHGHHVIRNRSINTFENCRWLCGACHIWVHAHPSRATQLGLLKSATARRDPVGSANPDPLAAEGSEVLRAVAAPSSRPQPNACPTHGSGSADTSLEPLGPGSFARFSTREQP